MRGLTAVEGQRLFAGAGGRVLAASGATVEVAAAGALGARENSVVVLRYQIRAPPPTTRTRIKKEKKSPR